MNRGVFWGLLFGGLFALQAVPESLAYYSDYSGKDLAGADFSSQNLSYDDFYQAVLSNTVFSGATVRGTDFGWTTDSGFTSNQLYSTQSYQNLDLREVRLSSNTMIGWDFSEQNLEDAVFWNSNLGDADFSDANLSGAELILNNFSGINFRGAVVQGANFFRATQHGLTSNQFYSTSSYQSGDLSQIMFNRTDLSGWEFSGKNLKGAEFYDSVLSNTSFRVANLEYAIFFDADLRSADLSGANLSNANMDEAITRDANFEGAIIQGINLYGASRNGFTSNQFYSTSSYQNGDLSGVNLGFNNLVGWDFSGKNLSMADFDSSSLSNASFVSTNLEEADFGYGNLEHADFTGAFLKGASLGQQSVAGATFDDAVITDAQFAIMRGMTSNQIYSTASYKDGNLGALNLSYNELNGWNFSDQNLVRSHFWKSSLSNATFQGSNMQGASLWFADLSHTDFSEANLNKADLAGSILFGADFAGATIQGADFADVVWKGFTSNQFYSTASYKENTLSEINLSQNDLSGWDFSGQQLGGASFEYSILTNATFRSADLSSASFYHSNLSNADLSQSDLRNVDFQSSQLTGTSLDNSYIQGANLSGIHSNQLYSTASYKEKDLSGVQLRWKDLNGWDFSGQNLTGADFYKSRVEEANFNGANLHHATLAEDMPSFDIVAGAEVYIQDAVSSRGLIRNLRKGALYVDDCLRSAEYYQEQGAQLFFCIEKDDIGNNEMFPDTFLDVGGRAEFEAGAVVGLDSSSLFLADRSVLFTNRVVSADELVVDGVSNPSDLSSLTVINSLIEADFYAFDNSIFAVSHRLRLSKVAGFAEGSMMAKVSDALEASDDERTLDQLLILDGMSGAQQNAQLRQRYGQGAPTFMHTQGMLSGQKQVLAQSQSFLSGKAKSLSSPSGAMGPHEKEQGLRGWVQGYGTWSDRDGEGVHSGYDQNLFGTVVGLDRSFGNLLFGVAGGYAQSDLTQDNRDQSDAKTGYGILYGSAGTVDWFGDMNVSYGQSRIESTSGSALGGSYDTDADSYSFYMGGGKKIGTRNDRFFVTPEAALLVTYFDQDGYVDGVMGVDGYDRWSYQSRLGGSGSIHLRSGQVVWKPELRAFWLHEFNADAERVSYSLGGSSGYSFGVRGPDEDVLEVGLGLGTTFSDRLELVLDVDGQFSAYFQSAAVSGRVEFEF